MGNNGRITETLIDSNGDGTFDTKQTYTLDVYGNNIKVEIDAGNDGVVDTINNRTYGANNELLVNNVIEAISGNVTANLIYEYNDSGLVSKVTSITGLVTTYEYNSNNQATRINFDRDGDGVADTWNTDITYNNMGSQESFINAGTTSSGVPFETLIRYEYNAANQLTLDMRDNGNNGSFERLTFGAQRGNYGATVYDHSENLTQWSNDKLATFKLTGIGLSEATAHSTLILSQDVMSKVFGTRAVIYGDATDTVTFTDHESAFAKQAVSEIKGYDEYHTTIDNMTYTLFIQDSVNVNFS